MDRRGFLIGGSVAAAAFLSSCARRAPGDGPGHGNDHDRTAPRPSERSSPNPSVSPEPLSVPSATPPPLPSTRGPLPAHGAITELAIPGPYMAWTVDDGTDPDVVLAYVMMAEQTGNRLTFFLNGDLPAWTQLAPRLRPLVTSGQIQLGNHTWSHPDLRQLSRQGIQDQLQRNEDFITSTYGVSAKPFYRPPYGYLSGHVREAAAAIGYTAPTLWYGSLSDSSVLTSDQIASFGDQWFAPGRVVIAHANHPGVIGAMQHLVDDIAARGLRTVTLRDAFAT